MPAGIHDARLDPSSWLDSASLSPKQRSQFYLNSTIPLSLQRNMNHKRGVIAFVVAFVLVFFFGFVWHGILMKPAYMETSGLWRTDADFQSHFWVLILGHLVIAFAFTGLYVSKIGQQNVGTGIGYGIVIGILCSGVNLIRFAVEPLTAKILWMWIAGDLIMFALMGAAIAAIYKPRTTLD